MNLPDDDGYCERSGNIRIGDRSGLGEIDEVRLHEDPLYSSQFNSPSNPFTSDANTILLYHFEDSLIDSSNSNLNGGRSGDSPLQFVDSTIGAPSPTPTPADLCANCSADTNNDGVLNALDITQTEICFNKPIADQCSYADANKDGRVDKDDLNCVIRNIGNKCPVPSPTPTTKLDLTLSLTGIGIKTGDNASPLNKTRQATLEFFKNITGDTTPLTTKTGTVTYDTASGNFKGTVDLGNTLTTDNYIVKVKIDKYLKKQMSGVISITPLITNVSPLTTLIPGDVNNDNRIDTIDGGIITACFGKQTLPCLSSSDLNDDGKVDGTDYNLFVRSSSSAR